MRHGPYSFNETKRQIFRRLWAAGLHAKKIAEVFGWSTPNRVYQKAIELGLERRGAQKEPPKCEGKKRLNCLMCRKKFNSEGPGNRVCEQCKKKRTWKTGGDFQMPNEVHLASSLDDPEI